MFGTEGIGRSLPQALRPVSPEPKTACPRKTGEEGWFHQQGKELHDGLVEAPSRPQQLTESDYKARALLLSAGSLGPPEGSAQRTGSGLPGFAVLALKIMDSSTNSGTQSWWPVLRVWNTEPGPAWRGRRWEGAAELLAHTQGEESTGWGSSWGLLGEHWAPRAAWLLSVWAWCWQSFLSFLVNKEFGRLAVFHFYFRCFPHWVRQRRGRSEPHNLPPQIAWLAPGRRPPPETGQALEGTVEPEVRHIPDSCILHVGSRRQGNQDGASILRLCLWSWSWISTALAFCTDSGTW